MAEAPDSGAPDSLKVIEFTAGSLRVADRLPQAAPEDGFVWIYLERDELDLALPLLQRAAQTLGGSQLLDLHTLDLGLDIHPSNYDYTSVYDLIVFRRLALPGESGDDLAGDRSEAPPGTPGQSQSRLATFGRIRSQAVGFVIFDRLLISVHPAGCPTARGFVKRFLADIQQGMDAATARSRRPTSPADLVLRMINGMVDSYLELRRDLTAELERWQAHLLRNDARNTDWNALMHARSQLHVLEDLCEEQLDAMQEWLDSLREQPLESFHSQPAQAQEQRDMLVARARDVVEHIERVMQHARRLQQSAETVVQIHFSAQGNRTNDIMRVLTTLTAIFLPLNLIAGVFGMNFKEMPLLDWRIGFWVATGTMALIALGLSLWFWRKRYLDSDR
ncbi:magnesium transporter CorA family protein [Brachymonas denitrificans]|uniref:magnesium transporter CorA family protein n=1 Tax=Brachymonas denitrificans TaxID=28220 RepID=UPI001BCB1CAF|nr:magnesium transporter CorA family protein [Brachymonas denitrificans]